ncbi:Serine/threonine exchanger SteT [bacterium HR33]|nr:Serine/threonine exchanger SteT [bacterium HR33]
MVVGTIIGASIFVQPSAVTGAVPSVAAVFGVWIAAGVLTLFGALICAELASAFPRTGGVYVFLNRSFSPLLGFLWGWAMFWTMHSGIIAAISMVFARYAGYLLPLGDAATKAVAVATILLLSAVNYAGVHHGSALQTWFTVGKVGAVLLIIVAGFWLGADLPQHFVGPAGDVQVTVRGMVVGVIAGLFAFGGWHMVTYAAEETVEPKHTLPRALFAGTLLVTFCYLALNAVYLYVLPFDVVARSHRVAADAADALLGRGGGAFMAGLVMFSTFGALSGIVLAGPRVYFQMARDGLLFSWLGRVHPAYRTPYLAIALQGLWSSILVLTGTYEVLFTRVIYTEWIFFALMAVGLILLRKRPDYAPVYRVPGYPWIPAAFASVSFGIVANQIISEPVESATGLLFVALGWPAYLLWRKFKQ